MTKRSSKTLDKRNIEQYLKQRYFAVKDINIKKLGSGWHGSGYLLTFSHKDGKEELILKTIAPLHFSHDYVADKISTLLISHAMSKEIPRHIQSIDVIGKKKDGELFSLTDAQDAYQIERKVSGDEYAKDLERIKKTNLLKKEDLFRSKKLATYLAKLHKKKYKGEEENAQSLYLRHTRDCIGNGEMLYGVLDTYPDTRWLTQKDIIELIRKAVANRQMIRKKHHRLSRIHGDFHQFNIYFNSDITVLDSSRELWGDPADDVSCLAMNYIWYAIMTTGSFSGAFAQLFEEFYSTYITLTDDTEIKQTLPLFFAFRGIVVAHPTFYKDQTDVTRKKIFRFINNVLQHSRFDHKKIQYYID